MAEVNGGHEDVDARRELEMQDDRMGAAKRSAKEKTSANRASP